MQYKLTEIFGQHIGASLMFDGILCCLYSLPSSTENTSPSGRGVPGVCSSTLEKLRGFTCLTEPSVGLSDAERHQKTLDGSGVKASDRGSGVQPPHCVADRRVAKSRSQRLEEENEDEEEEEDSSGLAASKKVPHIKDVTSITVCCAEFRVKNGGVSLNDVISRDPSDTQYLYLWSSWGASKN